MAVKIPDPLERFRPAGLHGFIFRYQKSPLLKVIPFNCPVVAIVAHRILLSGDLISEFVNLHNCEERSDEAIHLSVMPRYGLLRCARNDGAAVSASNTGSRHRPRPDRQRSAPPAAAVWRSARRRRPSASVPDAGRR